MNEPAVGDLVRYRHIAQTKSLPDNIHKYHEDTGVVVAICEKDRKYLILGCRGIVESYWVESIDD